MPKAVHSEIKTMIKSGRQVPHASGACNVCRERKGRCENDGVNPCKWCVAKNQDCSYRSTDARYAAPNKQAVEASKLLLETLQAENDALRNYIRTLKGGANPNLAHISSSVDRNRSTEPVSDAEIEALADQARHLVVLALVRINAYQLSLVY